MDGDLGFEGSPVPKVGRSNTPHVVLELTLRDGGSLVGRVGSLLLSELARSLESGVVDGLEDLDVELLGLGSVEGHSKDHEGIGESLHSDSDGSVSHVGVSSLDDGVL